MKTLVPEAKTLDIVIGAGIATILGLCIIWNFTAYPEHNRQKYNDLVDRACNQKPLRTPGVCNDAQFEAVQAGYVVTLDGLNMVVK